MKRIILISLFTLNSSLFTLSAAVPLRWTVETSRLAPAVFDVVRGETIDLEAALQSDGKPFAMDLESVSIFWQTNGMGNAWWSAPATVKSPNPSNPSNLSNLSNIVCATFTPDMDPGAATVIGFLGSSGSVYRAAFTFRFRHGPGAVPNVIELPPRVLDLAHTVVINPPWPTDETIDARIRQVIEDDHIVAPVETNVVSGIISNTVTKSFVEDLGISGGGGGVDTNAVKAIVDAEVGGTNDVKDAVAALPSIQSSVSSLESSKLDNGNGKISVSENPDDAEMNFSGVGASVKIYAGPAAASEIRMTGDDGSIELTVGNNGSTPSITINDKEVATEEQVDEAKTAANEANVWSSAVYNFMTGGRTNCWFSGTNYVFGTDAAARTRFAWEDGMDAATVPCSMALWEIRDGERQIVCDQRDWTAWYWSFKASQMQADIQGRIDALGNAVTNNTNYAWAKRYASDGTPNPDASTTFIDTPSVTLSPGMKWETVATVSGSAYWTIVGNGAVIGGSGTNAVLRIRDFEGNDIMTVTKGEHRLAWLEDGEIVGQMTDGDGWVCFDMLADAEPVGYFSTTLDASDFVHQTDPDCPAQYSWENIGGGKYRVHFLLKPGIVANSCFAKFHVEVEGQTIIRYNAGQEISGGLIYNGVRIVPDVSGSPAVGTVIQWKVAN